MLRLASMVGQHAGDGRRVAAKQEQGVRWVEAFQGSGTGPGRRAGKLVRPAGGYPPAQGRGSGPIIGRLSMAGQGMSGGSEW